MSPLHVDPELAPALGNLAPYGRLAVERAARYALLLHADELAPEHLLASLLEDEECGATRFVLHVFADPETIGTEVMALCPGILVVASERSLPFSVLGLRALEAARADAAREGALKVTPDRLFAHALPLAPQALRDAASAAPPGDERGVADATAGGGVPADGPLFRAFSMDALRALGAACRAANRRTRRGISPVHLVLGCLEVDDGLRSRTGLGPRAAAGVVGDQDADETELPPRALSPTPELQAMLRALAPDAGTVQLLAAILEQGTPELSALLSRQKITLEGVRSRGHAFEDPDPPPAG